MSTARSLDPYRSAAGLDAWKASGLFSIGRQRRFSEGEVLLAQGEAASYAILITRGLAKVVTVTGRGKSTFLAIRGEGDFVGEEAVITSSPPQGGHSATIVTAITAATAQVFPAESLKRFLKGHPAAMFLIVQGLCERATDAEARLASAARDNADRRLARLLWELGQYGIQDGGGRSVPVPLTQAELASWIGVSRETAERALRSWRSRGIITTSYRKTTIHDVGQLARIAGIEPAGHLTRGPGHRRVTDRQATIDKLRTKPSRNAES